MLELLQALRHHSCHHVKTMFSLQEYQSFLSSALPGVIKGSELRCVCCHTYTHIKSLRLLKYVMALIAALSARGGSLVHLKMLEEGHLEFSSQYLRIPSSWTDPPLWHNSATQMGAAHTFL